MVGLNPNAYLPDVMIHVTAVGDPSYKCDLQPIVIGRNSTAVPVLNMYGRWTQKVDGRDMSCDSKPINQIAFKLRQTNADNSLEISSTEYVGLNVTPPGAG
jgi:hypothetical protein